MEARRLLDERSYTRWAKTTEAMRCTDKHKYPMDLGGIEHGI